MIVMLGNIKMTTEETLNLINEKINDPKIKEYLDILIENQNMTNDEALKNLASEKDYLLILKPIIDI